MPFEEVKATILPQVIKRFARGDTVTPGKLLIKQNKVFYHIPYRIFGCPVHIVGF
jgi:hypothetical protein